MNVNPIGHALSPFKEKFGVPRQPDLMPSLECEIKLTKEYSRSEILNGLEGFERIWILFHFDQAHRESFTVRPPRLGGNQKLGAFATRSPFRPNNIGLSNVKYLGFEKKNGHIHIKVSALDLVDGTPILDIKPYIPETDSHPEAKAGWTDCLEKSELMPVHFTDEAQGFLAEFPQLKQLIIETLQLDPTPRYQEGEKEYGVTIGKTNIRFIRQSDSFLVQSIY